MKADKDIEIIALANYFIKNNSTVRQAAREFGISKSTVHKYLSQALMNIDISLYEKAQKILNINKAERHMRGGQATKQKYIAMKKR